MKYENELINTNYETRYGRFRIKKLLGKGKSGYSYLVELNNKFYVLKLMHDEPCPYYSFGGNNKVALEIIAYYKLKKNGILLPELIYYDSDENYLVKEYIKGFTAAELISKDQITDSIIEQLFQISSLAKKVGQNIDYFPTNFVINNNRLFYIDYECNPYLAEWDLENWGIYYWANNNGFHSYLETGDILHINESVESGRPKKDFLNKKILGWIEKYNKGN